MHRALLVIAFSLLSAVSASAAVFERDWQSPGDGLLTYDNVSHREWLDLSLSILDQFPGTSFEQKFENAKLETGIGGMFEGFTVAKGADAEALALSAGVDISTANFQINYAPVLAIINLMSPTYVESTQRSFAYGAIDEQVETSGTLRNLVAGFSINDRSEFGLNSVASFNIGAHAQLITDDTAGLMLYRAAVPEPSTTSLVISLSIALGLRRQFRKAP